VTKTSATITAPTTVKQQQQQQQDVDQGVSHPVATDGGGVQDRPVVHDRQEKQGRDESKKF